MSFNLVNATANTLVSTARLSQNAQLSALVTSNPTLIQSMLQAATVAIQRYTHRDLLLTTYTEYNSGGNYPYEVFHLQQFPVTEITRIGTNPQSVLTVVNTNSTLNQRATISTTTTGVRLYRMASGVATTTDLSATSYPTIGSLATAIGALGNGWTATVQGSYTLHPTVDLRPLQGAYTTLNGGADLFMHTEEMSSGTSANWSGGSGYDDDNWGSTMGWRLDDGAGTLRGRFPRGSLNIRVDYSAGFAVIPDDLQEACVQLILDVYNASLANQSVKSGSLGPYRFDLNTDMKSHMSPKVRAICDYYRDTGKLNLHR